MKTEVRVTCEAKNMGLLGVDLLTTDNLGKALEIQAMLAKHGIVVSRAVDGTKSLLRLKAKSCSTAGGKCTTEKRDMALMLIVESGLYDQNVGLEVFDKGDFTSTKEDKRIRLVRAMARWGMEAGEGGRLRREGI